MAVRFDTDGEGYVGTTGLPGGTFTVTWWANIAVSRNYYTTFISIDSAAAYCQIATDFDGVTPIVYTGVEGQVRASGALTLNTWYAMAYVQDAATGQGTIYWGTDPATLSSVTSTVGVHTPTHFRIGGFRSSGEWLNGSVTSVKLWNAALTPEQVTAELQSYDAVVGVDLLRVHKLQQPETTDYSGHGYTLTGGSGAAVSAGPTISTEAVEEPGRFLMAFSSTGAGLDAVTFTNQPTQPLYCHYDQEPLSEWAHPGALVVAGRARSNLGPPGISPAYEGTDPGYIAAAEAGACVIAYIDPIIDSDWGLYHELLHHEFDSLGRTVGPASSLWPGPIQANEWGRLADFRPGSVIQQKFGAVLNLMLDENPWLGGFFIDDTGTRSWFPGFSWENDFTATDRTNYRNGAIGLVQTARQVCDARRMPNGRRRIIIVNGTWGGGSLLAAGGGYPNSSLSGCSLVEGALIEHPSGLTESWTNYALGPQWATEASTGGVPFIVSSHYTTAEMNEYIAAGIVSHAEAEDSPNPWGDFHETGLPDARTAGGGTTREVLFEDDFSGVTPGEMADPNKWYYETGGLGWGDNELQAYRRSASNAYITEDGMLAIVAREEAGEGGANYTSARLTTREALQPFTFVYGRIEARIKVPVGQGMFPAFWTSGDYDTFGYPGYGEIDILETLNDADVARFHSHQPGWDFGVDSPVHASGSWGNDFHVYAVEWTPDSVEWFVDDVSYAKQEKSALPVGATWVLDESRPQAILLNLAVGGDWAGPPDGTTVFPATMLVDWVRVLAPEGE